MEFRVIDRQSLDVTEWDRLSRAGSFFQTVTWADVCVRGLPANRLGVRADAVFLCGYDNGRLVAGLPAVITRRLGVPSFDSMPNHTYGSALFAVGLSEELKEDFIANIAGYLNGRRFSRITITDFERRLRNRDAIGLRPECSLTHIVMIDSIEDFEPHRRIKRDLRTAAKSEYTITPVRSGSDIDAFYRLYRLTERRHGRRRPLYRRGFFHALADVMADSKMLYWPGLVIEGTMVASQINFIHGNTLINWRVVSDYEWRRYKPSQLLLYDAIEKAASMGVTRINLGASPPDAEGLIAYKERWGGMKVEFDIYSHRSRLRRMMGR